MRFITPFLILMTFSHAPLLSADNSEGKALHEKSCVTCHTTENHTALYSSEKRKVESLQQLGSRVSTCVQILNVEWLPEDEKKVVKFLNDTYYHFPQD